MTHDKGFIHAGNLIVNAAYIVAADLPPDDADPWKLTVHMTSGAPLVIGEDDAGPLLDALGVHASKKRKKKAE